jgi:alpha-N-arabinofuranosidase
MDAHNVPGEREVVAPALFKGGRIDKDTLILDVPAKSVVVVQLD